MPPRIFVFIGPECSGKTSLAEWAFKEFGIPFCPEYAREYALKLNRPLQKKDAIPIFRGQAGLEENFIKENQERDILILDTNLLSSIFYSKWYFDMVPDGLEEHFSSREYHKYFLFFPDIPWVQDPSRGTDRRNEMYDGFKMELDQRGIEYETITGTEENRRNSVRKFFDGK